MDSLGGGQVSLARRHTVSASEGSVSHGYAILTEKTPVRVALTDSSKVSSPEATAGDIASIAQDVKAISGRVDGCERSLAKIEAMLVELLARSAMPAPAPPPSQKHPLKAKRPGTGTDTEMEVVAVPEGERDAPCRRRHLKRCTRSSVSPTLSNVAGPSSYSEVVGGSSSSRTPPPPAKRVSRSEPITAKPVASQGLATDSPKLASEGDSMQSRHVGPNGRDEPSSSASGDGFQPARKKPKAKVAMASERVAAEKNATRPKKGVPERERERVAECKKQLFVARKSRCRVLVLADSHLRPIQGRQLGNDVWNCRVGGLSIANLNEALEAFEPTREFTRVLLCLGTNDLLYHARDREYDHSVELHRLAKLVASRFPTAATTFVQPFNSPRLRLARAPIDEFRELARRTRGWVVADGMSEEGLHFEDRGLHLATESRPRLVRRLREVLGYSTPTPELQAAHIPKGILEEFLKRFT